ncbi:MAG: hypothetical protein QNJ22_16215 [Desulfosarcinaceae bacterium]|nr:hypothetical protein [Desulfosarcinaceae bacterium]
MLTFFRHLPVILIVLFASAALLWAQSPATPTDQVPPTVTTAETPADAGATAQTPPGPEKAATPQAEKGIAAPSPATADGQEDGKTGRLPPPNRRWIIKEPQLDPKKLKKAPERKVKWQNAAQQKRCEQYLKEIGSIFLKARYYSIQGDACACAEKADDFLELYQRTDGDCPDNYLEGEGYTLRIARNMRWLSELGQKQCIGSTAPPPATKATAPMKRRQPDAPSPPTSAAPASTARPSGEDSASPLKTP